MLNRRCSLWLVHNTSWEKLIRLVHVQYDHLQIVWNFFGVLVEVCKNAVCIRVIFGPNFSFIVIISWLTHEKMEKIP
jgi:hypothetical protein